MGRSAVFVSVALAGCSPAQPDAPPRHPSLTFPTDIASGTPQPGKAQPVASDDAPQPSGGSEGAKAEGDATGDPREGPAVHGDAHGDLPDPTPLLTPEYWRLQFEHRAGVVRLLSGERFRFAEPVATPRQIGRYALELWIGRELIDRVRFDFPLLAGEAPQSGPIRPLHDPVKFAPGAEVVRSVLLPHSERATRLVLIDRATRETQPLPWPPDMPAESSSAPAASPAPDAGR